MAVGSGIEVGSAVAWGAQAARTRDRTITANKNFDFIFISPILKFVYILSRFSLYFIHEIASVNKFCKGLSQL
jgi:hypothetical protein